MKLPTPNPYFNITNFYAMRHFLGLEQVLELFQNRIFFIEIRL